MTKEQYINIRYNDYLYYWADIALKFGPIVTLSLIPLDYFVSPSNFSAFLAYRFCTAALLLCLYFFNKKFSGRKFINISIILAAVAVSTMVALMIAKFGGHQSPYAMGFILVGIFVSGVVPLSFAACLISSLTAYAIYLIPILLYDPITNMPHFASESVLIFASMSTMLLMRYFANKRLFHEFELQFEVEQHKTDLEEQVTERTRQLSYTIMHLELEIQERELAEKALIDSQEIFRHMADDSPLAISMITQEGAIEYVNTAHTEIVGYTRKMIPTLEDWWTLAYPEAGVREIVRAEWQNTVTRLFNGERIRNVQRKIVCKDGTIKDVELRIVRAADKIIVAFDDITERRRIDDLIRRAKDDWEDTFNTINDAITIHDRDFNIVRVNNAAERLLGKNAEEILRNNCFKSYHGTGKAPEGCPSFLTLQNGTPSVTELFEPHLNKYIEIKALPRFDKTGNLIGLIHIVRDITKSKRLEEQLLQAQKIEAIGQLAGGVAHDFNNILTAIVGYAHLTLMKMPQDEPLRKNVEQILQASDKAAALTQSLLAFSRKQIMNPKPVDLNDIVKKLEKLLIRLIREDIHITTAYAPEILTVFADSGQIEQVLMNLVTNARDAMPEGGQIEIKTEAMLMDNDFVQLQGYGKAGSYALLSVSDNGEGMDAKTREKIFEPFFTTKEQGKGTGLGLAMVYGIIKQHDGFIDVYSKPGKGTAFKIYLQLSSGSIESEKVQEETDVIKGGAETVLLAEDDSALRKLMTTILRNQGYTVIEATDGADAVQKYGSNSDIIQLLILDGIMPKKNGKEALDEIRLINPSVKALFVSGYAEDIISKQGLLETGINFIQKPLSPSILLKKVRELLDGED